MIVWAVQNIATKEFSRPDGLLELHESKESALKLYGLKPENVQCSGEN